MILRDLCRSDSIDSIQSKKRLRMMIDGGFNQGLSVEIEGRDYPGWAFSGPILRIGTILACRVAGAET